MQRTRRRFSFLTGAWLLVGCSRPGQPPSHPEQSVLLEDQTSTPGAVPADATGESAPVHPLLDDRQPDTEHALPELTFKHLGMHIGGESNAAEAKQPYLAAIERQSEALLRCYRWVDDPTRGGSFGVDLYVGSAGGAPQVRGVRTKLGGDALVQCMTAAFLGVEFSRAARPTVLSYSLLFALD